MGNDLSKEEYEYFKSATDLLKELNDLHPLRTYIEKSLEEHFVDFLDICRCSDDGSLCYEKKCMHEYIRTFCYSIKKDYIQTVYDMFYSWSTDYPYTNSKIYNMISNFVNNKSSIQRFYVDIMDDNIKNVCICNKPNSICTTTYALNFNNMYKITKCKKNIENSFNEYKKSILSMFEPHICKDISLIISEYLI